MTVSRFPLFSLFSAVLTAAFLAVNAPTFAAEPSAVRIWPVDPHLKIFGDSQAADAVPLVLRAARNEYESGQFGLRADADVAGLSLAVSDLTNADGGKIAASNVRLRPIGTIPVTKNTPGADNIVVRKAPFDAPDVLREETTLDLTAQTSKGVWVTLFVPSETAPGRYTGTITVASETARAELPLEVEVFRFELPQERHLWATNWFAYGRFATAAGVEFASEEYWAVLERYFRNMAEHRQNVVYVYWRPGDGLTRATRSKDGAWNVDFSRLERYLKLAEETGVGERFELVHVGSIDRDDNTINWADGAVYDEAQGKSVWLPSEEWLEPVLSRLEAYLVETGRIDRCMIHIADEPFRADLPAWRAASRRVREIAPKLRRIDAIESTDFVGDLEIWVPKLSHFDRWREFYEEVRADAAQKGADVEFWYYICCHPYGERYPNRFMDLPGSRVRAIHWLNYSENLTGYLHWGYNFWGDDPFGAPTEKYGPGDTHVVYPGPLDSIRWELERESVEDYEYFVLLENLIADVKKSSGAELRWLNAKTRSLELARRAIRTPSDVALDPAVFTETRLELAREIESLTNGPRLLVQTFPGDGATLVPGPVVIEFYGLTEPGATVSIGGKAVEVRPDGTFEHSTWQEKTGAVEIVATTPDGRTAKTVRRFVAAPPVVPVAATQEAAK